ncbi:MAG: PTS fructose transporter subunit IIA, partial [Rhodobacteraceae bacterium]|nr:PTS fructose transporter subunit IIA [Paracoccaceae bacterium]
MIGILIVAHGGLAKEYLAAVEHVVGRQVGMASVAIEAEHNRREKQDQICA